MRILVITRILLTLVGIVIIVPLQTAGARQIGEKHYTNQYEEKLSTSTTKVQCEKLEKEASLGPINRNRDERLSECIIATRRLSKKGTQGDSPKELAPSKRNDNPAVWKSESLHLLGIGLGVGDVTGDGKNDLVVIDPSTVHLFSYVNGQLSSLCEYSNRPLELKSVDVATMRKGGPCRIYVTAQNRATIASFVLEYRGGKLVPVIDGLQYYLRVIIYPTKGPILLGQRRGINSVYEGFIQRLEDKGNSIADLGRFGVPQKIPIFGFAIGDFEGKQRPLIAVYDRDDYIRIYDPKGRRIYKSLQHFGGSDVILRLEGIEDRSKYGADIPDPLAEPREYCRARIMSLDLDSDGRYEILATKHVSATRRMLDRTKMLQEGQVVSLKWNGDVLVTQWKTPKVRGMVTDFTVATLPGLLGRRLITLEREKTDWLSFLSSRSRVRAYDLDKLIREGLRSSREN